MYRQTRRVRAPDEMGEELRVSYCIDLCNVQWDEETIRDMFDQLDAVYPNSTWNDG
jgi:hypothetical protein